MNRIKQSICLHLLLSLFSLENKASRLTRLSCSVSGEILTMFQIVLRKVHYEIKHFSLNSYKNKLFSCYLCSFILHNLCLFLLLGILGETSETKFILKWNIPEKSYELWRSIHWALEVSIGLNLHQVLYQALFCKDTMWILLKKNSISLVYENNKSLLFTFIIRCLWFFFSCKIILPCRWDISPPIWSFSAKSVIPQQNIELSGRHGAQLPVWEPLLCVTPAFVPLAEGRIKTLSPK